MNTKSLERILSEINVLESVKALRNESGARKEGFVASDLTWKFRTSLIHWHCGRNTQLVSVKYIANNNYCEEHNEHDKRKDRDFGLYRICKCVKCGFIQEKHWGYAGTHWSDL